MPRIVLKKGLAPWISDKATWPLLSVIGLAGGLVGYNLCKQLLWNPDVQLSRMYRGTPVGDGKWDVHPNLGTDWHSNHQTYYRHKDNNVSRISLWEQFSSRYWDQRKQVEADPERFTASGRRSELH